MTHAVSFQAKHLAVLSPSLLLVQQSICLQVYDSVKAKLNKKTMHCYSPKSKLELNAFISISNQPTLSQVYSQPTERNVKQLPCNVLRIDGEEDMRGFLVQLQPFNSSVLFSYRLSCNPCQQISSIPSQTVIVICHIELF